MGLFRQMVGRVFRPAVGKDHCLVLDHAGAVFMHGFAEDPMHWTLDEDRKAESQAQQTRELSPSNRLLECSQCKAVSTGGKPCGHCGFMPRRGGVYLDIVDGDLAHLDRSGRQKAPIYTPEERREFHGMLLHIANERGYKPGWAAHKFKEKFGSWPLDRTIMPIRPNAEVLAWDRHLRIRYAKSMEAQNKRRAVAYG